MLIRHFRYFFRFFPLVILLLAISCNGEDCIEADDFGENDIDSVKVKAINSKCNWQDDPLAIGTGDYLIKQCITGVDNPGGKKVINVEEYTVLDVSIDDIIGGCMIFKNCSNNIANCSTANIRISSGGSDVLTLLADKDERVSVLNLAYNTCKEKCINSCSDNLANSSAGYEPNWKKSNKKDGLIGIDLAPDRFFKLEVKGSVSLSNPKEISLQFSARNYKLQDPEFNFLDFFKGETINFVLAGKWKDDNSKEIGDIPNPPTRSNRTPDSNIANRREFFRRGVVYLKPHPEGYKTAKNNLNKIISVGVPIDHDFNKLHYNYDTEVYSSMYQASDFPKAIDAAALVTAANAEYAVEIDGSYSLGGPVILPENLDSIKNPFEDVRCGSHLLLGSEKYVYRKCANFTDKSGYGYLVDSENDRNGLIVIPAKNFPYKIAFKILGDTSDTVAGTDTCTIQIILDNGDQLGSDITVDASKHWKVSDVVLKENTISNNSAKSVTIQKTIGDTWTDSNNNTISCGQGMAIRILPLHEVKAEKSGFVSFKIIGDSGKFKVKDEANVDDKYSDCNVEYQIINPTGEINSDFYEFDKYKLGDWDSVADIPTNHITATTTKNGGWRGEFFVRKGQVIRFNYDNWESYSDTAGYSEKKWDAYTWDSTLNNNTGGYTITTNPIQCGVGMVMKIEERPAIICKEDVGAVEEEDIPNPAYIADSSAANTPDYKLMALSYCGVGNGTAACVAAADPDNDPDCIKYCPKGCFIANDNQCHKDSDGVLTNAVTGIAIDPEDVITRNGTRLGVVTEATCGKCRDSIDLVEKSLSVSLPQCYNLENYTGRVGDLAPSTTSLTYKKDDDAVGGVEKYGLLTTKDYEKGARKLTSIAGSSIGNLENFELDRMFDNPDSYSDGDYYYITQVVSAVNEDSRLKFLVIDNQDLTFDTTVETDYTSNTEEIGGAYKIKNSIANKVRKNGENLQVILAKHDANLNVANLSTSTTGFLAWVVQYDSATGKLKTSSPYCFDEEGMLREKSNNDDSSCSNTGSNIIKTNKIKSGLADDDDVRLFFKVFDNEVFDCNIEKSVVSGETRKNEIDCDALSPECFKWENRKNEVCIAKYIDDDDVFSPPTGKSAGDNIEDDILYKKDDVENVVKGVAPDPNFNENASRETHCLADNGKKQYVASKREISVVAVKGDDVGIGGTLDEVGDNTGISILATDGGKMCVNRYANNFGSYAVNMKAEKDLSNDMSGTIVKRIIQPIIDILDGKEVSVLLGIPCVYADRYTDENDDLQINGCYTDQGVECSFYDDGCFLGYEKYKNEKKINEKEDYCVIENALCVTDATCYLRTATSTNDSCINTTGDPCFLACSYIKTFEHKSGYVEKFYLRLISSNVYQDSLRVFLILYITMFGFGFFLGLTSFTQTELLNRLMKIGIIYLFVGVDGWYFFEQFFVQFFKDGTDYLVFAMTSAFEGGAFTSSSITEAFEQMNFHDKSVLFNNVDKNIMLMFSDQAQAKIWGLFFNSFFGWIYVFIIYGAIFSYIFTIANAMLIYLVAQVFISILLSLGPIFFILLLFDKTKAMFDKWLSNLISFSLQQIFLLTVLGFFNMLLYEIFKFVMSYRVCWAPVWVIRFPVVGSLELFSYWKIAGTYPGADPQVVGAAMPGLFHILLIYLIVCIMKQFITFMVDLARAIGGGGIGAAGFANAITGSVSNMYKKYGAGLVNKAKTQLKTRALNKVGIKTEAQREAADAQNDKYKDARKSAVTAADKAAKDYKKNNLIELSGLSAKEQARKIDEVRQDAMKYDLDGKGFSGGEVDKIMNSKASDFDTSRSALGALGNAIKRRMPGTGPQKALTDVKDAKGANVVTKDDVKEAMEDMSTENRKQVMEAVRDGALQLKGSMSLRKGKSSYAETQKARQEAATKLAAKGIKKPGWLSHDADKNAYNKKLQDKTRDILSKGNRDEKGSIRDMESLAETDAKIEFNDERQKQKAVVRRGGLGARLKASMPGGVGSRQLASEAMKERNKGRIETVYTRQIQGIDDELNAEGAFVGRAPMDSTKREELEAQKEDLEDKDAAIKNKYDEKAEAGAHYISSAQIRQGRAEIDRGAGRVGGAIEDAWDGAGKTVEQSRAWKIAKTTGKVVAGVVYTPLVAVAGAVAIAVAIPAAVVLVSTKRGRTAVTAKAKQLKASLNAKGERFGKSLERSFDRFGKFVNKPKFQNTKQMLGKEKEFSDPVIPPDRRTASAATVVRGAAARVARAASSGAQPQSRFSLPPARAVEGGAGSAGARAPAGGGGGSAEAAGAAGAARAASAEAAGAARAASAPTTAPTAAAPPEPRAASDDEEKQE